MDSRDRQFALLLRAMETMEIYLKEIRGKNNYLEQKFDIMQATIEEQGKLLERLSASVGMIVLIIYVKENCIIMFYFSQLVPGHG